MLYMVFTPSPTQAPPFFTTAVHGPQPPLGLTWGVLTQGIPKERSMLPTGQHTLPCSLLLLSASSQIHPPHRGFNELELMSIERYGLAKEVNCQFKFFNEGLDLSSPN